MSVEPAHRESVEAAEEAIDAFLRANADLAVRALDAAGEAVSERFGNETALVQHLYTAVAAAYALWRQWQ